MGNVENKGNQSSQIQKGPQSQVDAESSFVNFLNKLTDTLDNFTRSAPKPEESIAATGFESYVNAYAGFAQNDISKAKGFSVAVKVDPGYQDLVNSLTRQQVDKDQLYGQGSIAG